MPIYKEVSNKEYQGSIASEEELYLFQLRRRLSIDEHINNQTKFLTDLINVDVEIEEEDKALILLNSLSDEKYETFVLPLINVNEHLTIVMYLLLL